MKQEDIDKIEKYYKTLDESALLKNKKTLERYINGVTWDECWKENFRYQLKVVERCLRELKVPDICDIIEQEAA